MRCDKCGCTLFSCNCPSGPVSELLDPPADLRHVDLTREEISIIAEDQEAALESIHIPNPDECDDLASCPIDHFDLSDPFSLDENPGQSENQRDLRARQALLKKLDCVIHATGEKQETESGSHVG